MSRKILSKQSLACAAALAFLLMSAPALARSDSYDKAVKVQVLMHMDVIGAPGREMTVELYTIPPKTPLPWHIHPGTQEIAYVVQGRLDVELAGRPTRHLKTGDSLYVEPDAVHRGINPSATDAVKLYVVRLKPKGQPATKEVDH